MQVQQVPALPAGHQDTPRAPDVYLVARLECLEAVRVQVIVRIEADIEDCHTDFAFRSAP